jgi:SAM-dependent methyltransferase
VSAVEHTTRRRVLDAGCGKRQDYVEYPEDAHVVGLDVSADALALNRRVDEKVVGDIQTYPLEPDSFDLVVCWWVLEHLPRPLQALENMAGALKQEGRLIVAVPNLISLKGLVTKFTPLRFHAWARGVLYGNHEPPNKTYLRWGIRPEGLRSFAARHGLEVEELTIYDRRAGGLLGLLARNSEVKAVLRKPAAQPEPVVHSCP